MFSSMWWLSNIGGSTCTVEHVRGFSQFDGKWGPTLSLYLRSLFLNSQNILSYKNWPLPVP